MSSVWLQHTQNLAASAENQSVDSAWHSSGFRQCVQSEQKSSVKELSWMLFSLMKHSYQVLIVVSREWCYPYRKLISGSFRGEGGVEIKKKDEHMRCKIFELLKTAEERSCQAQYLDMEAGSRDWFLKPLWRVFKPKTWVCTGSV